MTTRKPLNIAILAMGGEGGGVLTDWLVQIGEQAGYLAQKTSVPGVAQRTGATIYYVELFPNNADTQAGRMPVLGLMPMPGDIDLLIASELMEAGRAVQRGLVTPDRTHFIASTHRVYSMMERTAVTDGRVDADAIIKACKSAALDFVGFDMQRLAEDNRSVISAVLLGAVAASNALPFARANYEDAIRGGGQGAKPSLAAFAAGYAAAQGSPPAQAILTVTPEITASSSVVAVSDDITGDARRIVLAGIDRTADYQDRRYAQDYYDRLKPFIDLAKAAGESGQSLLGESARQLALGMTYEDTVRVAELKIRTSRFQRVHQEIGAAPGQIIDIVEFMHPRIEEIADTMPAPIGRWLLRNRLARSVVGKLTSRGRMVRTTSLSGFLMLYVLASMKGIRRSTLRFSREQQFLAEWLETVHRAAALDMSLAVGFVQLRNLVKGYGETHQRGLYKYERIRNFILKDVNGPDAPTRLKALIAAAELDEHGEALETEIHRLTSQPAAVIAT